MMIATKQDRWWLGCFGGLTEYLPPMWYEENVIFFSRSFGVPSDTFKMFSAKADLHKVMMNWKSKMSSLRSWAALWEFFIQIAFWLSLFSILSCAGHSGMQWDGFLCRPITSSLIIVAEFPLKHLSNAISNFDYKILLGLKDISMVSFTPPPPITELSWIDAPKILSKEGDSISFYKCNVS